MELDLAPGESRGYWKYHAPEKWFRQAKAQGKINNLKATLLFDSGAEVSIIDTTFARKVGCIIDESQKQECVGIGENVYMTMGRTKIKITLAGSLVYYFDVWVGDQSGQEAILGMDFMVPAGIRLDLADGTLCLPDEIRIHLSGRRPPYSAKMHYVTANDQHVAIPIGGSTEVKIATGSIGAKLWVTRGPNWVPIVTAGFGRKKCLHLANLSDQIVILPQGFLLGIWMEKDMVARTPGYVSIGSQKYNEWQTLAYEAMSDRCAEVGLESNEPLVAHPQYITPTGIMRRKNADRTDWTDRPDRTILSKKSNTAVLHKEDLTEGTSDHKSSPPDKNSDLPDQILTISVAPHLDRLLATERSEGADDDKSDQPEMENVEGELLHGLHAADRQVENVNTLGKGDTQDESINIDTSVQKGVVKEDNDEEVGLQDSTVSTYYHDSDELFAEEVDQNMAVLPEIRPQSEAVTIDDIQVGYPDVPLTTNY